MGAEQGVATSCAAPSQSCENLLVCSVRMAFGERFVKRALAQVTRYFTNETIRSAALEAVLKLVDARHRVLIGHSLGSVVAYEATHLLKQPLPVLITLGSPLGYRQSFISGSAAATWLPASVQRWSTSRSDDFIAAEPDLKELFVPPCP